MLSKISNRVVAASMTIFCVLTIGWFSCNKEGSYQRCEGVICENGGFCAVDTLTKKPKCTCPAGFEGPNCATAAVTKYIGDWNMRQIVTGSDSAGIINDTSYYTVSLTNSATPTTFFINNFANNRFYNQIVCTLDSANSYNFGIDTISAYHMLFDAYKLLYGYGYITTSDSFIIGTFAEKKLSSTANWMYDTVQFRLSRRY